MPDPHRRGFTLPAVLAVTGVVTLIFLVAITALGSLTAEAASARARITFTQRAMTAEALLSYMAATEPLGPLGLSVGGVRAPPDSDREAIPDISGLVIERVRLDGRPYLVEVDGPMVVHLQDEAGLVNMSILGGAPFERLMERLGAPASMTNVLAARYIDYTDLDDLRQPNGAERRDYRDGAPANRRLLRPAEFLSVLGARDAIDTARWRAMRPHLAADSALFPFNINTASAEVLRIEFGLTENQARAVIEARESLPILSVQDMAGIAGAQPDFDVERIYAFPANAIIFTLKDTRSAWVYRGRLALTPAGVEQPVWIEQTELIEAPGRAAADTSDATRLSYAPR